MFRLNRLTWRVDRTEGRLNIHCAQTASNNKQVNDRIHAVEREANDRLRKLEYQVAYLTKALEWHVGTTIEIMNMEEQLIMARVDHQKERGERFGEDGNEVAKQTCDGINQSVNQKLNNDVSPDTDKGQDTG